MGAPGRRESRKKKVDLDKLYAYMDERSTDGYLRAWESAVPEDEDRLNHDHTDDFSEDGEKSNLWSDEEDNPG